jgi:hypothetical protein
MSGGDEIAGDSGDLNATVSVVEAYEEYAERFQSDTRRYLTEHLLDEYRSVGQAVEYNLIQNVWDNRIKGQPLTMKFIYSSKDKRFQFIASGYEGIKDWERYNRLHTKGSLGAARRGEGAKVLIPIAELVRTETRLADGTYLQAIWVEEKIWRSDKDEESQMFHDHFPPTAISAGSTAITVEGVYDDVGDRKAGLELANAREMVRYIQLDWDLLLREHPEVMIIYDVDGKEHRVKPWDYPELLDEEHVENLRVVDASGKKLGLIQKMALFLSKSPLTDLPPPAIALCTDHHAVTYQSVYGGPNANRLFGYVRADFLAASETTNHLAFKSTRAYRQVRDIIAKYVDDFMRRHAGIEKKVDPKTAKMLAEVTDQINQLIRERFPDWHPEGGFIEKREPHKPRTQPWIRNPKTNETQYEPEDVCILSFEIVNPAMGSAVGSLEARATVVRPDGSQLFHKIWNLEVPPGKSRVLSDIFQIPADAPLGTYPARISLVDASKSLLHERRLSFALGDAVVEEEKEPKIRRPKRKRKVRKKRGDALRPPFPAIFPEEDEKIRESALDRDDLVVYLNKTAPSYTFVMEDERAHRYHVAKCQIEELSQLKLERELGLLEPDELTKERIIKMLRHLGLEKSTFLSEWARMEAIRVGKKGGPLER